MFFKRISTPWRIAGSGLAAALALSLLVAFTPQGQTVASAFLAQFRPQQIAAVEITPQSQAEIVKTLAALGNLGTVNMPGGATRPEAAARTAAEQSRMVSLAEASRSVGFAVETPDKVASRIRDALRYVSPERLIIAPDCGMKYLPRDVAFSKLSAMVEGAKRVRAELGEGS